MNRVKKAKVKARREKRNLTDKPGSVLIADSEITKCSVVGIYSQGAGARQSYLRLTIENIDGPGIRVHKGN